MLRHRLGLGQEHAIFSQTCNDLFYVRGHHNLYRMSLPNTTAHYIYSFDASVAEMMAYGDFLIARTRFGMVHCIRSSDGQRLWFIQHAVNQIAACQDKLLCIYDDRPGSSRFDTVDMATGMVTHSTRYCSREDTYVAPLCYFQSGIYYTNAYDYQGTLLRRWDTPINYLRSVDGVTIAFGDVHYMPHPPFMPLDWCEPPPQINSLSADERYQIAWERDEYRLVERDGRARRFQTHVDLLAGALPPELCRWMSKTFT